MFSCLKNINKLWTVNQIRYCRVFRQYDELNKGNERRLRAMTEIKPNDWVILEKVHGANFGIYTTKKIDNEFDIYFSKRTAIIRDNEDFFGYQCLIPTFKQYGTTAYNALVQLTKTQSVHCVLINGELFGGKYNHPDVPKTTQRYSLGSLKNLEVFSPQRDEFPQYSPDLHFIAFDLKYKATEDSEWVQCSYDEMQSVFEQTNGMLYCKPLLRGELEKVIAFDYESYETMLPTILGLGDYPMKGNFAEGIILRHVKHHTPNFTPMPRLSANDIQPNTILKIKGSRFQEIRQKGHLTQFEDPLKALKEEIRKKRDFGQLLASPESVYTASELEAWHTLQRHITSNRLQAVLSKLGPDPFLFGDETPQSLSFLLAKDAIKDFIKDEAKPEWINMPLLQRENMAKHCIREAELFVIAEWPNIVDIFFGKK